MFQLIRSDRFSKMDIRIRVAPHDSAMPATAVLKRDAGEWLTRMKELRYRFTATGFTDERSNRIGDAIYNEHPRSTQRSINRREHPSPFGGKLQIARELDSPFRGRIKGGRGHCLAASSLAAARAVSGHCSNPQKNVSTVSLWVRQLCGIGLNHSIVSNWRRASHGRRKGWVAEKNDHVAWK